MNTGNVFNLKSSNKPVYDITKFTHLDYPQHLACIIWFQGCNMRCKYCYNKDIVFAKEGIYSIEDVLTFLRTRKSLLDAVVLSGGEATNHDLISLCKAIKDLGFLIKLDTNGTNIEQIKSLLLHKLIDYVALDYKAPKYKFFTITHSHKYEAFSATLNLLIEENIDFEVRTTLHADLLNEEDINAIISDLHTRAYKHPYYIQEFKETSNNIGNLTKASKLFDKSKLSSKLKIIWR